VQVVLVDLEPFWRNSSSKCGSQSNIVKDLLNWCLGSSLLNIIDIGTAEKLVSSACLISSKSVPIGSILDELVK